MNNHIQIIDGIHNYYGQFFIEGKGLHYWDISYSKKIKESFTTQILFIHLSHSCIKISIKQVGYGTESYFEKIFDIDEYHEWENIEKWLKAKITKLDHIEFLPFDKGRILSKKQST